MSVAGLPPGPMSPAPVRCVVADDHPALLAAVEGYLRRNGFDVVALAASGLDAVAAAERERPDVALVDYRMPGLAGRELVRALREAVAPMGVAVYTAEADAALVAEALAAGADAIVLKEAPLPDLVRALGSVVAGRAYLDPGIEPASRAAGLLTDRELAVLRLIADGRSYEEIARRLEISVETVRSHSRKASVRLGARTRTQAVATAVRQGLL